MEGFARKVAADGQSSRACGEANAEPPGLGRDDCARGEIGAVQLQNMQRLVGLLNRGKPDQSNDARMRQFAHHGEFPEVFVERDQDAALG